MRQVPLHTRIAYAALASLVILSGAACSNDLDVHEPLETAPQRLADARVSIDWSMPDVFGHDFDGDGFIDLTPVDPALEGESPVVGPISHPRAWKVTLDGCGSTPASWYQWTVGLPTGAQTLPTTNWCASEFDFPLQGTFPVTLRLTFSDGSIAEATRNVTVKNYLVVSMGDSVASGEGNPDVPSRNGSEPARWVNRQCHRSALSGPAQAALALERGDSHTSVTFISVACSGATIDNLVGPYAGIEPGPQLPAQIDQVSNLICPLRGVPPGFLSPPCPTIDALLISVGANDVGFGSIVHDCAIPLNTCSHNDVPLLNFTSDVLDKETALKPKYDNLDGEIRRKLNVKQIYATEYFDPTHDDAGQFCSSIQFPDAVGDIDGDIDHDDVVYAHDHVINTVNLFMSDAAIAHGWSYVSGIAGDFRQHGYCANDHWIVHFEESGRNQPGDNSADKGTMHPNGAGQAVYTRRILAELQGLGDPTVATAAVNMPNSSHKDLFLVGPEGNLWQQAWTGATWSGWTNLGNSLSNAPAAVWGEPNTLDVVASARDGTLQLRTYDLTHNWSDWIPLPRPKSVREPGSNAATELLYLLGRPILVSPEPFHLYAFMRASDGTLRYAFFRQPYDGLGWVTFGAPASVGTPVVIASRQSRLDVFVRGVDGALYHGSSNSALTDDWQWESLGHAQGHAFTGDPAVVSWGPGRLDVFARADDFGLWHQWSNGQGDWGAWEPLGGYITSAVDVSSWGLGRLDIFARGLSQGLTHDWYEGGWGTFGDLGGNLASASTTLLTDVNTFDTFFTQKGGAVEQLPLRPPGIFQPVSPLSLLPAPSASCGVLIDNQGLIAGSTSRSSLASCDGRFRMTMQDDGALVLYEGLSPLWSSPTAGTGAVAAIMQASDGNFVIYNATGTPIWATNTTGSPHAFLALEDTGDLAIIAPSGGSPTWTSNTCCH